MEKISLLVEEDDKRIDKFISERLQKYSRSKIERLIVSGKVSVNGDEIKKKNHRLKPGDRIEIICSTKEDNDILMSDEIPPLKKLFEDEHILIIDKPSGIAVHPGSGERKITIMDIFLNEYPEVKNIRNSDRPGIVHRLDKGTSGVLVLAKNYISMRKMQKKFRRREVKKTYYGIVSGEVRFRNGTINTPLSRNPKDKRKVMVVKHPEYYEVENIKESETSYSLIYQFKNSALMRFEPKTGRTHQIRVHMSSIGNPLMGDDLYGKKKSFKRLALHAYSIRFTHPIHDFAELISFSPLPDSFKRYFIDNINIPG